MRKMIIQLFAVLSAVLFSAFSANSHVSNQASASQTQVTQSDDFVAGEDFTYVRSWYGAVAIVPFY